MQKSAITHHEIFFAPEASGSVPDGGQHGIEYLATHMSISS